MEDKYYGNALFAGIRPEDLETLHIGIEDERFESGEIIFEDGDQGDDIYLVAEGAVRISKQGRGEEQETLAVKQPGDFFGEMAVLDHEPRSARATAEGATVLGRIDAEAVNRFLSRVPDAPFHFLRAVTHQLRSTSSRYVEELLKAERLSLLGSMMSSIVHDLKNPVATIMMAVEALRAREDDPRSVRMGELIGRATNRLQTMIQELLEFSRGQMRVELREAPLSEVMETLDAMILNRLASAGVEVRREIDYEKPFPMDQHRLVRLLGNIVANAAEAMKNGGTLTIRARREGDMVQIEIEDTGCGIPAEILPKVFEPFVTHGKSGGTGLGMAIAKAVVEAHRGKIRMESEEGKGTTCHIALPAGR